MATVKERAVNNGKGSVWFQQVTGRSEESFSHRWKEEETTSAESHRPVIRTSTQTESVFIFSLKIHQDDDRKMGSKKTVSHCPILSSFLALQLKICVRYFATECFHQ